MGGIPKKVRFHSNTAAVSVSVMVELISPVKLIVHESGHCSTFPPFVYV